MTQIPNALTNELRALTPVTLQQQLNRLHMKGNRNTLSLTRHLRLHFLDPARTNKAFEPLNPRLLFDPSNLLLEIHQDPHAYVAAAPLPPATQRALHAVPLTVDTPLLNSLAAELCKLAANAHLTKIHAPEAPLAHHTSAIKPIDPENLEPEEIQTQGIRHHYAHGHQPSPTAGAAEAPPTPAEQVAAATQPTPHE